MDIFVLLLFFIVAIVMYEWKIVTKDGKEIDC